MVKSFWFFLLLFPFFSFSQFSFEHSIYFETDEFFIEKKDPLILPPDYEKLPTPGDRRAARQEISIFEDTLTETDQESDSSSSIEESILKKIKKQ